MFRKALLVEDIDSIGHGVALKLQQEVGIENVIMAQYCDDAYIKLIKAIKDNRPYELLITDLSFKQDHRERSISSGKQLIKKLRDQNINIPIIVYSVEERPALVKKLIEHYNISAYVLKGRNGLKNMVSAVEAIEKGIQYTSPELADIVRRREVLILKDYDTLLLDYLSKGFTQEQFSSYLKERKITPSSLSSIEKRLNFLKDELKAKNTIQLVANAKDLGLI